jgi:hypothetical protein
MAGRSCFCVAHYLLIISTVSNKTDMPEPSDICLADQLIKSQTGMFLLPSPAPLHQKYLFGCGMAKNAGTYVAVITDSFRAPVAAFSDDLIRVEYKSFDFHNSVMPCFIICEILISLLTSQNPESVRDNLAAIEETLRSFDVHSV